MKSADLFGVCQGFFIDRHQNRGEIVIKSIGIEIVITSIDFEIERKSIAIDIEND